jgi:hypothetical protein
MIGKLATIIILLSTLMICTDTALGDLGLATTTTTPVASEPHDLTSRYVRLSCAVVKIIADATAGTGFFVDSDGTLVTAAHVTFDKKYVLHAEFARSKKIPSGTSIINQITPKRGLRIQLGNTILPINLSGLGPIDSTRAGFDMALIHTGLKPSCFIPLAGSPLRLSVGEHLISIGIPASAPGSVLYDGFVSALYVHPLVPVGFVEGHPDVPVFAGYWLIRAQMPITLGVSGSPLISDANEVVGVLSEEPVINSNDISEIERRFGGGQNINSGSLTAGFDLPKIVGELAWTMLQFESPGAGYAVPSLYLNFGVARPNPPAPSATVTPSGAGHPSQ